MTTTNTPTSGAADLPEALRSIQRFEVVDCIDDKHVPAVIPKPHGPWVRYEDHIAALAAGQATAAPARDLAAVIKGAADKLDAAVRCHPNAVDTLIHEALEILDGDREPDAASRGQAPAGATPECLTCSDHGAVGNILTAEPCPDCTRLNAQPAPATQQEAQEPATVPRFNCWSTNEGDSWFDHPADAQAIYDCLGNDAKVGDEYELAAGWQSVMARYRITEVVGDGEEYEVECISHPQGNTAPQPSPTAQADSVQEDAARYRWLAEHCRSTSEHWGGRWSIVVEGPVPKSHDSEDDFDAAIDAARKQGEKQ